MEEMMEYSQTKKEMYEEVALQLKGLFEDCPHMIANLANASAVLNQAMKEINWVGFYLCENRDAEEKSGSGFLVLGPFQGKPACVEIQVGKGVCGTAVEKKEVMLVKDVHEFPGHIACDSASRSEIVLPIRVGEAVVGVLDIDSPYLARFDEEDKAGLEKVISVIEEMMAGLK